MTPHDETSDDSPSDSERLHELGYEQELARVLGGFSNFALSLSIICILSGGVTSFHLGFCSVGGAAIGVGWPLVCLFSLSVALAMGQVASAFPTAGGLYHWASILGGRGWGWATAWFNLAGLVTVLAAINVGTYEFASDVLGSRLGFNKQALSPNLAFAIQVGAVLAITGSQALFNHLGLRLTSRLTDFSGYWILVIAALLTAALLANSGSWDASRLVTFENYSGPRGAGVWNETNSLFWLFALGSLLPAYTITGFDASAHVAEETREASHAVPRGIVRSVLASGLAGWVMLMAVVLAMPSMDEAAAQGVSAFRWTIDHALPGAWGTVLLAGIVVAQYLCGLATVTSASRMTYAFARDGGLPFSAQLKRVSDRHRVPAAAIWAAAAAAVLFTIWTPVYATITAVCTILLYISYVVPTALGLKAHGRSWTRMGPWDLGRLYRPLAGLSVLGCGALILVGIQPPNEKAIFVLGAFLLMLSVGWLAWGRAHFPGPPEVLMGQADSRGSE